MTPDSDNPVVCNCGRAAVLLTVRKEGPNQGKQFYKCEQRDNACDFFLWHDSASVSGHSTTVSSGYSSMATFNTFSSSSPRPSSNYPTNPRTNRDNFSSGGDNNDIPKCDCNVPAVW